MQYQQKRDMRTFTQILFWISCLFIILASTNALATPAINAPNEISEGETLEITYEPQSATLTRDGTIVANNSPYEWETTLQDAGLYEFTIIQNDTELESTTLEVTNTPLEMTINKPNTEDWNASTIPISTTPSAPVDLCYYTQGGESNTLTKEGDDYEGSFTKEDGIYTITIKCKQGDEIVQEERTILIDTTPPEITQKNPSQGATIASQEATITTTTDEVASCKAWEAGSSQKNEMQSDDRLTHEHTITQEGTHDYRIQCTDTHGNKGLEEQLSFTLDKAPTAKITIEDHEEDKPLKAGSYEIIVEASEPVKEPALEYELQTGGSREVALTSEQGVLATTWRGYLSIQEEDVESAASFSITLEDENDNAGESITQGKLFLIDTKKPAQVKNLEVAQKNHSSGSRLELSWDEIEDATYKIYRDDDTSVTLDDFLTDAEQARYTDYQVENERPYYYAVLAVDEAGNEGILSEPKGGLRVATRTEEETEEGRLYEAGQLEEKVERAILDLEAAHERLERERDERTLTIIQELELLETITQHKEELEQALEALETLPQQNNGFDQRITQINDEIEDAIASIPERISVTGSIDYEQPSDTSAINQVFDKTSENTNSQLESQHRTTTDRANEQASFEGTIITASIDYASRDTKHYTYVEQQASFEPQEELSLYVHIPKALAQDARQLRFTPEPEVVEQDPLLKYDLPQGENTFSYSFLLEEERDLSTARSLRNVLIPAPPQADSAITGQATNTGFDLGFESTTLWYVIGAMLVAGLTIYYVFLDDQKPQTMYPTGMQDFFRTLTRRLETPQQYFTRREPELRTRIFPDTYWQEPTRGAPQQAPQSLSERIIAAHEAIDEKEYIPAKEHYESVVSRLEDADDHDRAAANLLYYKLLLYKSMSSAVQAANKGDHETLTKKLNNLKSIAQKVPESDSRLIQDAKEQYRTLSDAANELAIKNTP